ncbi:hypothetical protein LOC67_09780 [Stieleria sp. JC731]|uniref:hypothetical protein n=1 Tax=Pirellulaceae TaxID=2691357 RepID=UPI001E294522|nr:hypothetical protein [Stieleria sp. JC731]MCC9600855.1 hypothetical protein [Stieleria sp. JC731]
MDAIARRSATLAFALTFAFLFPVASQAASKRSANFYVSADSQALADAVSDHAERYRRELAIYWLGKELPPWPQPCPIKVVSGPRLAAQGATTYNPQPVSNFRMEVIGTTERILDSVLPHEVTHTVMATHFGRPLPRWADEGICTTVEHAAERDKHERKLREFLRTKRGIAMNRLFLLTEYPQDMLPMYAQGYSVCRFLVEQQGPRQFINFLEDWMQSKSWTNTVQVHYGYESLSDLQQNWLSWVADGSGPVDAYASTRNQSGIALASAQAPAGQIAPLAQSAGLQPINRAMASSNLRLSGPQNHSTSPNITNSNGAGMGQNASNLMAAVSQSAPGMSQSGPAADATASMAIGALGDASGQKSWYQRRREENAMGKIATVEESSDTQISGRLSQVPGQIGIEGPANSPISASRSDYSVSQPQDEVRYGQLR